MKETADSMTPPASERPESIFAPGQMVHQIMEKTFVSDTQAARRLGLGAEDLQRLYAGELEVGRELAMKLKDATGYTASYWLGFERQYRHRLKKWREKLAAQDGE